MKRRLIWIVPMAALAAISPGAIAQGPPNMSPEMMAKFKAWGKFRESHKNYQALQQIMFGLGECQKDPKTALNKAQAQRVLGILHAWENKPVMTNEQAGQVTKQMEQGLNLAQIKVIATTQNPMQGGRGLGGGQRGAGGPGGARPGGPPANFKMPDPKEFNPLNPDTMPFEQMRGRVKQRLAEFKA